MKVIVKPNVKNPIRGLLSRPFTDEKVLDLTEMQIKRVLNSSAKVFATSLDGIKGEIKLTADGHIDISDIENNIAGNAAASAVTRPEPVVEPVKVDTPAVEEKKEEIAEEPEKAEQPISNADTQHMTKAQRKAARRAEAQQKAEAAKKESEGHVADDEDAAKENAQVVEDTEEIVEE